MKSLISRFSILFILLFLLCSCNETVHQQEELFSYNYDFQFYDIENSKSHLKASTLSTLQNALEEEKTCIFIISSSHCISCKTIVPLINDIATSKNIYIYLIDPYSELYPIINTPDFDNMLNLLKDIGINNENEFSMPVLLVINNGNIDSFYYGYDYHEDISTDELNKELESVINKSYIIK